MKYNAPPTLGISAFNPPAVPCPFSVAAIKNQSIQSQNVVHSSPIPFPVTVFPALPEEHVTMVTNPSSAQTKSTFLARLPSKKHGIKPSLQPSEAMNSIPLFLSGVNQCQTEGYLSFQETFKEGNSRMSFSKSYQCLSVIINMNSSSYFG